MHKKLEGLIAAPFTALHEDGRVNLETIAKQAAHLVQTGVAGAFVCGTTGEGASLTIAERQQIAERWVAAKSGLRIIVHTGHNCLADSQALAAHAREIGAYATAAMAPSFFKPRGAPELVDWCQQLAAATPDLPFYYYHIPSMTGVNVSIAQFLSLAQDRIPNLAGVKFTYENLMDFSQSLALSNGRFDLLFGRDEMLLCGLALGACGAVGSTYNYSAAIYRKLMAAFAAGDLNAARRYQAQANAAIDLLIKYGGLPAGKAVMKMIGIDCGPVRLPLKPLTSEQYETYRAELQAIEFFDAIQPLSQTVKK